MSSEFIRQHLEGKAFSLPVEVLASNEIPSVAVWGKSLPEAWEDAVLATYEFGAHIPTEYDQDVDPESRDVSMMMTVAKPFAEPRIHRSLPVSFEDLGIYVAEVVDGVHDLSKVNRKGHGWTYSYHDRLFNWPGLYGWDEILNGNKLELPNVDQVDKLMAKLAETPYSRRAQAITWVPQLDQPNPEPPCLQRIWCRLAKNEGGYLLEMNTHWRSNDALKAAFMNTFALTDLQKVIAGEIGKRMGKEVGVGRYVGMMDSFHIYGSYQRKNDIPFFLSQVENMPYEKRVARTDDPLIMKQFEKAKEKLAKEKLDKEAST
jgi:thymidylate synthase